MEKFVLSSYLCNVLSTCFVPLFSTYPNGILCIRYERLAFDGGVPFTFRKKVGGVRHFQREK